MVKAVLLENFSMKKILLFFVIICTTIIFYGQEETAMIKRLNETLLYTKTLNLEKILDYTYPKLFKIVSRDQMLDALKGSFDNEEFSTTLDSLHIIKVYPIFTMGDESFAKIKHTMVVRMKFKEPLDTAEGGIEDRELFAGIMEEQFGEGNVRYDYATDQIVISMLSDMIAIKNKDDCIWYFVNFNEDEEMITNMLFSKAVLEKLKEYN